VIYGSAREESLPWILGSRSTSPSPCSCLDERCVLCVE
jgi:hypothetical protein